MQTLRLITATALCLCTLVTAAAQDLAGRLAALVETTPLLQTSEVGIAVYDLTADRPVYQYQSRKLCRPASIEKVITCVSALHRLGTEVDMRTELYATGEQRGDTLVGDLYVKGGFDTLFDEADLQQLVEAVRRAGITTVTGSVWGDITMKDSLSFGEGWSWDDARFEFQPMLSPLTCNRGCVQVECRPASPGEECHVACSPVSDYYLLHNASASLRPEAGKLRIGRDWIEGTNEIIIRGNVDRKTVRRIPLARPELFFVHLFCERLQQAGITATGYATAPTPPAAKLLADVRRPMSDLMREALKESDNLAAEAVFYRLAAQLAHNRPATAQDGAEMVGAVIGELGFDSEAYRIADGSGLSPYNYVSPDLMLGFLTFAYRRPDIFEPFYEALPIAGVDGTLAHRMKKTKAHRRVRAKTGTVTGICSLAGYAKSAGGHLLAFVIMNQNVLKAAQARAFQDKFCTALCE